jgi:cytochrome b
MDECFRKPIILTINCVNQVERKVAKEKVVEAAVEAEAVVVAVHVGAGVAYVELILALALATVIPGHKYLPQDLPL